MAERNTLVCYAKNVSGCATIGGEVLVQFDFDSLGIMTNVNLALALRPEEARFLADLLRRKADEAEAATSQRQ